MIDKYSFNADTTAVYYSGHSLGGAVMPDFVNSNKEVLNESKGMILMGSFLTRKWKDDNNNNNTTNALPQVSFPIPTLTIGAELDGLCRITRIAEAMYTQINVATNEQEAKETLPVTVIPGMNHYQFASGDSPPKLVAHRDLKPEISGIDAHKAVALDVVAFLTGSQDTISNRVSESQQFMSPQINAFLMEGYHQYKPPCYCESPDEYAPKDYEADVVKPMLEEMKKKDKCTKIPYLEFGTCITQENCLGGCKWTSEYAMSIMANANETNGLIVNNIDSIHIVTEECPSCHLPHIHGGINRLNYGNPGNIGHENKYNPPTPPICASYSSQEPCILETTSITQQVYDNSGEFDIWRKTYHIKSLDTGYLPLAAKELRVKLKSRQAVMEATGQENVDLKISDVPSSEDGGAGVGLCSEINQKAIDWAYNQLSPVAATRYKEHGQILVVKDDVKSWCGGGPCWIWDDLKFKKEDSIGEVHIQSVYMVEDNYNKFPCGEAHSKGQYIPCPTGFHYCKLLSPAKALEWMTVDGLRLKYLAYE
jgi:hypothetical protein